jgi:methylated-DNA-[protein]-cysteine S-methyltransferase
VSWAWTSLDTPIGPLLVAGGDAGLRTIRFPADGVLAAPEPGWKRDERALGEATDQLRAYFAGERRHFELELAPVGTPFQRQVWRLLAELPYGTTTSYGSLARALGKPGAARAVGAANGRNPLPIVLPCHRVVGADGSLTGFGGGLEAKRWLLRHEGIALPEQGRLFRRPGQQDIEP